MVRSTQSLSERRQELARCAEAAVAERLKEQGFEILGLNVRAGRYELDIAAQRGSTIVICEVRARSSDRLMAPAESITQKKLDRLRRGAALWLKKQRITNAEIRIDAAAVVVSGDKLEIEYYENVSCPDRWIP